MDWYEDWQHQRHAALFDGRSSLGSRALIRNYEAFNDVRLLNERLEHSRPVSLLEVGCATGEFSRYLRLVHPQVRYYGVDISEPAVARAKQKDPQAAVYLIHPHVPLAESLAGLGLPSQYELVYAKDVLPHQTRPFEWLAELAHVASDTVIVRCRTRDVGATELNPDVSCQYHYGGWMPYLVLNLQEVVERIAQESPGCEVVVYRHHMVLGGQHGRFLPKDLYLKETGTAETAIGIFKRTQEPGRVLIKDRVDQNPPEPWHRRLVHLARRVAASVRPSSPGAPMPDS